MRLEPNDQKGKHYIYSINTVDISYRSIDMDSGRLDLGDVILLPVAKSPVEHKLAIGRQLLVLSNN